jgi:hypothetical protein
MSIHEMCVEHHMCIDLHVPFQYQESHFTKNDLEDPQIVHMVRILTI